MKSLKKLVPLVNSGLFRGLGAVSQLFLAFWITHRLSSKEESGQFLFYLTCFTFASPMLLFGTQQFAMRHLSQFEKITADTSRDAVRLAKLSAGTLLIVLCVLLPIAWLVDHKLATGIDTTPLQGHWTWLVLNSVFGSGCLAIAAHFHGARRLASSLLFSHILTPLLTVTLLAFATVTDADQAIKYHGIACLLTLGIGGFVWLLVYKPFQATPRDPAPLASLAACIDLWLLNTFILIVNWSPLIIAGLWLADGDIAELNIAQRAANLINFLLIVLSFAFAPRFRFAWAKQDLVGLRKMVSRCSLYLIGLGTPLAILVIGGAPWIMAAFGSEYVHGATLLVIFAVGQYFNLVTGTVNQVLTMCNHERTLRNICLISSVSSLVLGVVLVIQYGTIGAALAVAFAVIIQNAMAAIAVKRLLGFWAFDIRRPAAVAV